MIIYPAIDIKEGKCVRLLQGDAKRETIYSEDPLAVALAWREAGAKALHLVDLDGAFSGEPSNSAILKRIAEKVALPIQVGGGIRTMDSLQFYLEELGVAKVILGTIALKEPKLLEMAISSYGDRIIVGIDAQKGKVAINGWTHKTQTDPLIFGKTLKDVGVNTIIYTDIAKDGMLKGPNLQEIKAMITETKLNIIASGGVSTLEDIAKLKEIGVQGIIIGQALYQKTINLADALIYEED